MGYFLIFMTAALVIGAIIAHYRKREKELLLRLEKMLEAAKQGTFVPEKIDESILSSVENSMSRFLEDSSLAEGRLREQKERIQTLISDISHQTITPVSNILLYSQLLEEQSKGEEAENEAGAIRQEAEKLGFLLDSLVKTSRLENGIIRTMPEKNDVNRLVNKAIVQARPKAEAKKISIDFAFSAVTPEAMFDFKWTAEALFNIIDNAVKYTPEGGNIEISIIQYSMFCRIDVMDTGIGISEAEIQRIFERFYRSKNAIEQEGVGLGLYLAREIITGQKGYIKVASKPGEGTQFSVFLPSAN